MTMTQPELTLAEQLSALMDGELPETQARFLRRRLEHDSELRELWSRMHLASSCIKGQPVMAMTSAMSLSVRGAISDPAPTPSSSRTSLLRWGIAASLAVLALMMGPRLLQSPETGAANPIAVTPTPRDVPGPSSADLMAVRNVAAAVSAPSPASMTESPISANLVASNEPQAAPSSPMPLDAQSPADFPLADNGDKRSWPRSQVLSGRSDPSLEAYLVRHNQMLANDGLGGFVPYVDVVARDPATTQDSDETAAPASAGADSK